jgi:hypothetical protein
MPWPGRGGQELDVAPRVTGGVRAGGPGWTARVVSIDWTRSQPSAASSAATAVERLTCWARAAAGTGRSRSALRGAAYGVGSREMHCNARHSGAPAEGEVGKAAVAIEAERVDHRREAPPHTGREDQVQGREGIRGRVQVARPRPHDGPQRIRRHDLRRAIVRRRPRRLARPGRADEHHQRGIGDVVRHVPSLPVEAPGVGGLRAGWPDDR